MPGLRTLCLAVADIDPKFYASWNQQYHVASSSVDNRQELIEKAAERIEKVHTFLAFFFHPWTIINCLSLICAFAFSALTLLVGWQEGHPACNKLSGGVLAWLSVWSELQTCIWPSWYHCHLLSLASFKSRLVLSFWYRLTRVVLEKGPLNGCVCASLICAVFSVAKLSVAVLIAEPFPTWCYCDWR